MWDRNISKKQAIKILCSPAHPRFISLSSLLLSRKNTPREVFRYYIKPEEFCRYWPMIKRGMRKDVWNNPRIEFWQAVYEKLLERYRAKGTDVFSKGRRKPINEFCFEIGQRLKALRKENRLTQEMLSKKLNVSQQMISKIESGRENISLLTLKRVTEELGAKVSIQECQPPRKIISIGQVSKNTLGTT